MNKATKTNLIGLSREELSIEILKIDEKSFRSKQIWNWIYAKGVKTFSLMQNVSKEIKQQLEDNYSIDLLGVNEDLTSQDGTRKWLFKLADGNEIETVFIPESKRGTLCISSQIGCTLTCKFCHTGTQLLVRDLSAGEIVSQLLMAKNLIQDWDINNRKITNVVFMGMGEPLFNYDNVFKAIEIFNDPDGLALSRRKIIVSSSGLVPQIRSLSDEIKVELAISLHASSDKLRSEIMPINKKYPLKDLMSACQYYCQSNPSQKITFEYVMLKDVNDSDQQARDLVNMLKNYKLTAIVNLIPFNPWEGSDYECSSRNRIMNFSRIIEKSGYRAPIRKTRGQDVMAACGQLKSESLRLKKVKSCDNSA